ncbi:NAD-dependent epimerase/dehydratase family protein [Nonomuraea sp. NPDC050536]|uniref:NAD-dependent epimerase/dehydratase family protein n=1 Tax=Nonomuraea sp. NPDC050536 TaxID=3364366 RepID=UPI0037CBAC1F
MTRILLFGATGFIGIHVRERLAAEAELVCPGRADLDLHRAVPGEVAGLLREVRPSIVLNCVGTLAGRADEFVRGNAGVTATLLEAIAMAAPQARFVRLGSAAEYGPTAFGHSVKESDPTRPTSAYGISHLAGTLLTAATGISLRIFNPVGPGISAASVLGKARDLMREAEDHVDLGPLDAYRDFVDVRDVAEAVACAAFGPAPAGIFNVGSGKAVTVREAVRLLAEETGFTGEIREGDQQSARSAAVSWSRADVGRAREVLGWKPRHTLDESIKAMV